MQARCIPGCVENVYGQIFYKQVLTNGVVINLVDVLVACAKRYMGGHVSFETPGVPPPPPTNLLMACVNIVSVEVEGPGYVIRP
jgi:hypothetical protein